MREAMPLTPSKSALSASRHIAASLSHLTDQSG